MNTSQSTTLRGYRLSFIINTIVGSLMLLLATVSYVIEIFVPTMRGTLAVGMIPGAVICLFIGSVHYSKYLSLSK